MVMSPDALVKEDSHNGWSTVLSVSANFVIHQHNGMQKAEMSNWIFKIKQRTRFAEMDIRKLTAQQDDTRCDTMHRMISVDVATETSVRIIIVLACFTNKTMELTGYILLNYVIANCGWNSNHAENIDSHGEGRRLPTLRAWNLLLSRWGHRAGYASSSSW